MSDELVDRTAYLNLLEDYTKAKERIAQLEATLRNGADEHGCGDGHVCVISAALAKEQP